jgi:hypothetical protein
LASIGSTGGLTASFEERFNNIAVSPLWTPILDRLLSEHLFLPLQRSRVVSVARASLDRLPLSSGCSTILSELGGIDHSVLVVAETNKSRTVCARRSASELNSCAGSTS